MVFYCHKHVPDAGRSQSDLPSKDSGTSLGDQKCPGTLKKCRGHPGIYQGHTGYTFSSLLSSQGRFKKSHLWDGKVSGTLIEMPGTFMEV